MNSLRGITKKIDAMLIMVIAGLILSLALSYNYYQTRRTTVTENESYAASLLAHGLPGEAAAIIAENIRKQPIADRSLKLRKVLAELYMNELNDFEKALSELVFIKNFAPDSAVASGTEEQIRYCLNRLGRVYDVERRRMLEGGENPVVNNVVSETVVRLGNRHAIGLEELKQRIAAMNLPPEKLTRETIDGIISGMTQELLLSRAAERENIKHDADFISRVRKFEKSLAITNYLRKFVFKNAELNEEKQRQLLADEINRLAAKEEMQINREVIAAAFKTASDTVDADKNAKSGE